MPYNFVADIFHTKKLRSRLLSSEVHFYTKKGSFAVFRPLSGGGGFGTTYDINLRLIGKCVVDFLLTSIELFLLDVTVEALRAKID